MNYHNLIVLGLYLVFNVVIFVIAEAFAWPVLVLALLAGFVSFGAYQSNRPTHKAER